MCRMSLLPHALSSIAQPLSEAIGGCSLRRTASPLADCGREMALWRAHLCTPHLCPTVGPFDPCLGTHDDTPVGVDSGHWTGHQWRRGCPSRRQARDPDIGINPAPTDLVAS